MIKASHTLLCKRNITWVEDDGKTYSSTLELPVKCDTLHNDSNSYVSGLCHVSCGHIVAR